MKSFQDDPVLIRIRDFPLDDAAARFPFSKRLARENRWSHGFALQVIEEYKKFCYLAMQAGHPVAPSEEVDQAWHLHLLHTRSYWEEFCGKALGQPFHHGPTRGGPEERAKFQSWYQATLDSYARTFGKPPPPEIWPATEARYRDVAAFRRVNTATHWVIPKPRLPFL